MHVISYVQLSDTAEKIQSTSEQIVSKLKRDCQCMLDATYITAARLSCDSKDTSKIIYRARLSSTPDANNTELSGILKGWVTSGTASVTLEHIQLNLDSSCALIINTLDDPICPIISTTEYPNTTSIVGITDTNTMYIYIGAILGSVVVMFIAVVCAFVIYHRRCAKYNVRYVKS